MFSIVHESDDSTTVNLSAYGRFIPDSGHQLLTIGGKYVRLFRTNPYALVPPSDSNSEWEQRTRLECVYSLRLLSAPRALATATIAMNPGCDSILLAFDDAKLSIVSVCGQERSLRTLSLHSFEDEQLKDGHDTAVPPLLATDPAGRCAAMLVYGRQLAVLPLHDSQNIRSYTTPLTAIDPRLENVLDMVFLDGYYEPTLLFLYEPLQTTAGRASIRFDTLCLLGVSVNTVDRQMAVVWQMTSLPMDCYRLLAVPRPIGGAVVVGANEVVYLNQAAPPAGLALNSCYQHYTNFPLKDARSMCLTLDASELAWLGEGRAAIGTKEGHMYVLTLDTDGTGAVKHVRLDKAGDISIPFTMRVCAPNELFVGSRLGDSQLWRWKAITHHDNGDGESDASDAKRARVEAIDEDDLALYGDEDEQKKESCVVSEVLEWTEVDRLRNVGPVKKMTAGAAHNPHPHLSPTQQTQFDIVTASGHGRDGAICVLHQSIRPNIITSSVIDGAQQLWAVARQEDDSHRYLIVSKARSSVALELGEEMVELEQPLFESNEPTVAAGELADGAVAVQVTSMSICLVHEGEQLQRVPLDSNFPVAAASIADPYVALLTQNGRVLLYELCTQPRVYLKEIALSGSPLVCHGAQTAGAVTAMCMYRDMSGLLARADGTTAPVRDDHIAKKDAVVPKLDEDKALYGEEDDEDAMLYGESASHKPRIDESRKRKRATMHAAVDGSGEESNAVDPNTVDPTYWLFVARDSGRLSVYSLPDLQCVWQVRKMNALPELLVDATAEEEEKERKEMAASAEAAAEQTEPPAAVKQEDVVAELCVLGMGMNESHPVLWAVLDDMAVAYQLFPATASIHGHVSVRMRRLPVTLPVRQSCFVGSDGRRARVDVVRDGDARPPTIFHPFDRIGSLEHGLWVCGGGSRAWLCVWGGWGGLRTHPMPQDGPLASITPFHNQAVSAGFIYLTRDHYTMRVATLPTDMDYETPMPSRKIPVGATVHHISYIMQSGVYAVVSSVASRCNRVCVVENDEKKLESKERPETFVCPSVEQYKLQLYSDQDWQPVPNTEYLFNDMEVVTSCEEVLLKSDATLSGQQSYIALGTICNYGEEVLIRGRIVICEVIEVVPEPGQPTSKHKIKAVYEKEQKGPVTALCSLNGLLLAGMGQKVFVWSFADNNLTGVAFLDVHYYVHRLAAVRDLALACDILSSCTLMRYQHNFKTLSRASRDYRPHALPPMAAEFLVDHKQLGFVVTDEGGNLLLFNYLPERKESCGGERLVLRAHLNLGTTVNALIRVKGSVCGATSAEGRVVQQSQSVIWSSLDGSFGYVRALNEKTFRRLHFVQQFVSSSVPQPASLNPKGARAGRPLTPALIGTNTKNVVDGDVVFAYAHLSVSERTELARRVGSSRYQILDDLFHLTNLTTLY